LRAPISTPSLHSWPGRQLVNVSMTRYRFRIILAFVVLLVFAGVLGYQFFVPGVAITLRNTGREVMGAVTIQAAGQVYKLGDLAPGKTVTQRVIPTSEAPVEVAFTGNLGSMVRLLAAGKLTAGSRGQIDIEIKDGKVAAVKNEVRSGLF
jgi:hypothetical protein